MRSRGGRNAVPGLTDLVHRRVRQVRFQLETHHDQPVLVSGHPHVEDGVADLNRMLHIRPREPGNQARACGFGPVSNGQVTDAHGLPLLAREAPAAFGMTDLDTAPHRTVILSSMLTPTEN